MSTPQTTLIKARAEGLQIVQPFKTRVEALSVLTQEDYLSADALLTSINNARKGWKAKIEPLLTPAEEAVKAAKKSKSAIEGLRDEYLDPLTAMYILVQSAMLDYKRAEGVRLQLAEAKAREEKAKLAREEEEKATRMLVAKTKPLQAKLAMQRAELQQRRIELENEKAAEPVKAEGSVIKPKKRAVVSDPLAFLTYLVEVNTRGIQDGEPFLELVLFDTAMINKCFRLDDEDSVRAWPGITIDDDITLARRPGK